MNFCLCVCRGGGEDVTNELGVGGTFGVLGQEDSSMDGSSTSSCPSNCCWSPSSVLANSSSSSNPEVPPPIPPITTSSSMLLGSGSAGSEEQEASSAGEGWKIDVGSTIIATADEDEHWVVDG